MDTGLISYHLRLHFGEAFQPMKLEQNPFGILNMADLKVPLWGM